MRNSSNTAQKISVCKKSAAPECAKHIALEHSRVKREGRVDAHSRWGSLLNNVLLALTPRAVNQIGKIEHELYEIALKQTKLEKLPEWTPNSTRTCTEFRPEFAHTRDGSLLNNVLLAITPRAVKAQASQIGTSRQTCIY